jgi:hypothetical protein
VKALRTVFSSDTNACWQGSTAWILALTPAHNGERVKVLVRSRSGRYVEIWCHRNRLGAFEIAEVGSDHPLYPVLKEKAMRVAA